MEKRSGREITYKITKSFGALRESDKGWTKELNLVSWNDMPEKYDIRDWNEDHSKCGRGMTLKAEEMRRVLELLKDEFPKTADE